LTEIGKLLKELAIKYQLVVLVTNVIVSKRENEVGVSPGLGVYWAAQPNTRVLIHHHPTLQNQRIAVLESDPSLQFLFELSDVGIKEVS